MAAALPESPEDSESASDSGSEQESKVPIVIAKSEQIVEEEKEVKTSPKSSHASVPQIVEEVHDSGKMIDTSVLPDSGKMIIDTSAPPDSGKMIDTSALPDSGKIIESSALTPSPKAEQPQR